MSFGVSVRDFAVLKELAWNLYKACKYGQAESFQNVSQEVASLHLVFKEAGEIYSDATLSAVQEQARLEDIRDGCRDVLQDLQGFPERYNRPATEMKRTRDWFGIGLKDIGDLTAPLISNTALLATFIK